MGSLHRLVLATTLAACAASCANDGSIDWRGGTWRDLIWVSYPTMSSGGCGTPPCEHGLAPTATIGSTIYVVGGGVSCSAPIASVAWSRVSRNGQQGRSVSVLPAARAGGGAAVLDGRLHFLGGCAGNAAFAEMSAFDFLSGQWEERVPMATARYGAATAVLDGKIYVAGGGSIEGDGTLVDLPGSFEVFDPATGEWTTLPRLPTERLFAAGAAVDGRFFVIGGQNSAGTVFYDDVEIYDPKTGLWASGASLSSARAPGGGAVLEGRIVVVGGRTLAGASDTVELYDPHADEWTVGPAAISPRSFVHPGVVGSKLYAAGGIGAPGAPLVAVEGLIPVDVVGNETQPQQWQESGTGGPGPGGGGCTGDCGGDGCSIRAAGERGSRAGAALLAAAAIAIARRRRGNRQSA